MSGIRSLPKKQEGGGSGNGEKSLMIARHERTYGRTQSRKHTSVYLGEYIHPRKRMLTTRSRFYTTASKAEKIRAGCVCTAAKLQGAERLTEAMRQAHTVAIVRWHTAEIDVARCQGGVIRRTEVRLVLLHH